VLELGAGSGLAGIVASRLGASNVVVTDGDETSIKLAAKNLANNHLDCKEGSGIVVSRLLWGECENFKADKKLMPENGFSVILAADVMYKKFLPPLLFGTMKQLLQPNGAALLVHLVRAGVTQEIVHRAAVDEGFEVTVLSFPMDLLPHHHCSLEEAEEATVYLLRHATTGKRSEEAATGADEEEIRAQADTGV
jgi:predicted nicotinamide N-methyase